MDGSSEYLVHRLRQKSDGYIVSIKIPPDCFDRICRLSEAIGIDLSHAAVLILRAGMAAHDAIDARHEELKDGRH